MMHVNPGLKTRGLAMVFNPTDKAVKQRLRLPLYYTGLSETATVSREGGEPQRCKIDRQYDIDLDIELKANGATWFVIE